MNTITRTMSAADAYEIDSTPTQTVVRLRADDEQISVLGIQRQDNTIIVATRFGYLNLDEDEVIEVDVRDTELAEDHYLTLDRQVAIDSLPEKLCLTSVSCDDQLTDKQVDMLLSGDDSSLYEVVNENFTDNRVSGCDHYACEAVEAARTAAAKSDGHEVELDTDDELLIEKIYDKDYSDPVAELVENTPPMLIRTHLGESMDQLLTQPEAWFGNYASGVSTPTSGVDAKVLNDDRIAAVKKVLAKHGLLASDEAVAELVDNGPWDWHEAVHLDALIYVKPALVAPDLNDDVEISITNPAVFLYDTMNGGGHFITTTGVLRVRLRKIYTQIETNNGSEVQKRSYATGKGFFRDGARGYSVNETFGLYQSSFAPENIERVIVTADKNTEENA